MTRFFTLFVSLFAESPKAFAAAHLKAGIQSESGESEKCGFEAAPRF
jgi:hypothetical protein